jgi:hypothetical protein
MTRQLGLCLSLLSLWWLSAGEPAGAADVFQPAPQVDSFRDRFELRFGVGAHGVGSVERGAVAINGELVFPQMRIGDWQTDPAWAFLIPRLHMGGVTNFSDRTSYGYVGALWTFDITDGFFLEGFLGGATHDGSLNGDQANKQAALGCRLLFHTGGSIGYRFAPQWTVMFTFDHVSNGNAVLNGCGRNQGLNEYLLRVGYSF